MMPRLPITRIARIADQPRGRLESSIRFRIALLSGRHFQWLRPDRARLSN
jgi:hypothetical protein